MYRLFLILLALNFVISCKDDPKPKATNNKEKQEEKPAEVTKTTKPKSSTSIKNINTTDALEKDNIQTNNTKVKNNDTDNKKKSANYNLKTESVETSKKINNTNYTKPTQYGNTVSKQPQSNSYTTTTNDAIQKGVRILPFKAPEYNPTEFAKRDNSDALDPNYYWFWPFRF